MSKTSIAEPSCASQSDARARALLSRWGCAADLQASLELFLVPSSSSGACRSPANEAHLRALLNSFDHAFASPASLMVFLQETAGTGVAEQHWPNVVRVADLLLTYGYCATAQPLETAGATAEQRLAVALGRHVRGLPRWTQGAGIEFVMQQRTPQGLWTSIPFWCMRPGHYEQAVIAGLLQGQARWAVAIGDSMEPVFLMGVDGKGQPMRAQDVLRQELAKVPTYETPKPDLVVHPRMAA